MREAANELAECCQELDDPYADTWGENGKLVRRVRDRLADIYSSLRDRA